VIELSLFDISLTAALMLISAFLNFKISPSSTKDFVWSGFRMIVQLSLIGFVLKYIFENSSPVVISIIALTMLLIAGFEIQKRQTYRFKNKIGIGIGVISISCGSVLMIAFALQVVIQPNPIYDPRYLIPILGMLIGNTMNGLAISLDALNRSVVTQRKLIEARLILGEHPSRAISEQINASIKSGLIPIINAMAAAGIVSLPGMMTGQILGGASPDVAIRYQIFIMLLIATATIISVLVGVRVSAHNLFDDRLRLRIDRITS